MAGFAGILFTDLLQVIGLSNIFVWYEAGAVKYDFADTGTFFIVQIFLMGPSSSPAAVRRRQLRSLPIFLLHPRLVLSCTLAVVLCGLLASFDQRRLLLGVLAGQILCLAYRKLLAGVLSCRCTGFFFVWKYYYQLAMLPAGLKDAHIRENNNQKVHPQPMEDSASLNQEALDSLISSIFTNVSSLKAAYIQLQTAHTPYDPDKIQNADKLVIDELKKLSELKHFYRENNPIPASASASPQDSRLAAEIQEQQNLLKTYEVMVKKFQCQIQNKDSEIIELQQQIQEAHLKRGRLEKKLKQRGLLSKELDDSEEENAFFSTELTPNLFSSAVESAYKSIHDFSKPLINLMKAAGWDLDDAANAIQNNVIYAKRAHKKYAFESYICQRMFEGFEDERYTVKDESLVVSKDGFFHQFLALRAMDPLDILSQSPDSVFGKFCRSKYLLVIHPKMEASFFGNQDQRNYVAGGGHPRTPFYQAFLKLAKSAWLLHRLAFAFEPNVTVFKVKNAEEFVDAYMESVVKNVVISEKGELPKVGFMVMPGFKIGENVIQCQVYLSGIQVSE